jgi:hypothetical protein
MGRRRLAASGILSVSFKNSTASQLKCCKLIYYQDAHFSLGVLAVFEGARGQVLNH